MAVISLVDTVVYSQLNIEHIGLGCIASYLRENEISVNLFHLKLESSVEIEAKKLPLDSKFYGFTLHTNCAKMVYSIAELIKQSNPDCYIFVGGRLATDAPNDILVDCNAIDFVVLGDGEYPVLEVIKHAENGEDFSYLPAIVTRNCTQKKFPSITKICDTLWPARDLLVESIRSNVFVARLSSSRGCCGNCCFCSHNSYSTMTNTVRWKGRDIEDVFDEMIHIYREYNIRSFVFNDASFEDPGSFGKKRVERFCNMVLEFPEKFDFYCYIRAESFKDEDEDLIKLMRQAGFSTVFIGIESASESDLQLYRKRATLEDNNRALRLFKENNFKVSMGFIMLNPLSTKESLKENFLFLESNKVCISRLYTSKLDIYYNTDIYHQMKELGLLKAEYTYLSETDYKFADPFVTELSDFLDNTFSQSAFIKGNLSFMEFDGLFSNLFSLFPNEANVYKEEMDNLRNKFADELSGYFRLLYVDNDLNSAISRFATFEGNMLKLINNFISLKLKVIRREPFKTYLLNNKNMILL